MSLDDPGKNFPLTEISGNTLDAANVEKKTAATKARRRVGVVITGEEKGWCEMFLMANENDFEGVQRKELENGRSEITVNVPKYHKTEVTRRRLTEALETQDGVEVIDDYEDDGSGDDEQYEMQVA